jgi:hypothetical protein
MATQRRKKSSRDDADEAPVRRKKTSSSGTSRSKRSAGVSKNAKAIPVDFSKEEAGGGRKRFKEGDYEVKFVSHEFGRSKEKETPYVQVGLEFTDGKYKGVVWSNMRTRLYLSDSSLWRLRAFLEAMGVNIPKKKVNINFSKYYGKSLGVTIVDGDPYEGRVSSEIGDFLDLDTLRGADEDDDYDEDEEEEDEDDEDEDEEEDEDEDEDDEDEIEEMDVDDDL